MEFGVIAASNLEEINTQGRANSHIKAWKISDEKVVKQPSPHSDTHIDFCNNQIFAPPNLVLISTSKCTLPAS